MIDDTKILPVSYGRASGNHKSIPLSPLIRFKSQEMDSMPIGSHTSVAAILSAEIENMNYAQLETEEFSIGYRRDF